MRPLVLAVSAMIVQSITGAYAAEPDRYRLEKTPDGYVRMDTTTGEMSICAEKAGGLVCRMAADERSATQEEIDRLQSELKALENRVAQVDALEERVARLENSLAAKIEQTLPTEEDFNRTMGYMERFFRSFMSIVKEFEQDKSVPGEPDANRT